MEQKQIEQQKYSGFWRAMISESSDVSSQRFAGLLVIGIGLILASLQVPTYQTVILTGALILGVKEARKAIEKKTPVPAAEAVKQSAASAKPSDSATIPPK